MRASIIRTLVCAAAGLLLWLPPAAGQPLNQDLGALSVGRAFPSLTLPSLEDGRPRSLSEFRGRKVILHVFASW